MTRVLVHVVGDCANDDLQKLQSRIDFVQEKSRLDN
jgi:hypothetical protein